MAETQEATVRITIPCQRVESKGGTAIMSASVGLTGFGSDEADALRKLETGIQTWCRVLGQKGRLDAALERAGITPEDDGNEEWTVMVSL